MNSPTVSVVVPAYNASRTINEAVRSALNQTAPPVEVIVVDDGSTDGTADLVHREFGQSVRVVQQENRGVAEARNRGIAEASGDYIQFLDSDDMLAPEKLERSLRRCAETGSSVVYGPARYVAADGATPIAFGFPPLPSGDVLLEWLTGTMANGTYGVASSMFARRDALLLAGGFEKECSPCEDWDMWIRLAAAFTFAALDEPLVVYRVMPGSLSSHALRMARGRLNTIRRARELKAVQSRIGRGALDRLEAGRWHVYAMRLWEAGRRGEARHAFAAANRLVPSAARRFYALMTYAFPASSTVTIERVLQKSRPDTLEE